MVIQNDFYSILLFTQQIPNDHPYANILYFIDIFQLPYIYINFLTFSLSLFYVHCREGGEDEEGWLVGRPWGWHGRKQSEPGQGTQAKVRRERAGWSGGGGHGWLTARVASEGGHWCILSPLYLHPPWIDPDWGKGKRTRWGCQLWDGARISPG